MDPIVTHPKHYNQGRCETLEFIEDKALGYHEGQVVKYVVRAGKKSQATHIEDLEKALFYLTRRIELMKSAREGREAKRPNDMFKERINDGELLRERCISIPLTDSDKAWAKGHAHCQHSEDLPLTQAKT